MKRWRPISLCSSVSFDAPCLELSLNVGYAPHGMRKPCRVFRCSLFGAFFKLTILDAMKIWKEAMFRCSLSGALLKFTKTK